MSERQAQLYPLLWGSPMPQSELENGHRRFDCVWDAMDRLGRDPRVDVECMIRQLDVAIACSPHESSYTICQERASRVCAISAEYRRAAQECSAYNAH